MFETRWSERMPRQRFCVGYSHWLLAYITPETSRSYFILSFGKKKTSGKPLHQCPPSSVQWNGFIVNRQKPAPTQSTSILSRPPRVFWTGFEAIFLKLSVLFQTKCMWSWSLFFGEFILLFRDQFVTRTPFQM